MKQRTGLGRIKVLERRWRLEGPLARGAQAAVYEGRDVVTGRDVVIKVLAPDRRDGSQRPTDLLRLRHEAEALAQLDHPAFVRLLDAGVHQGRTWLVMDRAPGLSLDRVLLDQPKPSPRGVALAAADLCDGLAEAHGKGLLHRDIKPSNLLWDGQRLRLVDWGLARVRGLHEDIDRGLLLGTLPYMALEAWGLGGPVDERADLYALAASLYEWLCGRLPFDGAEAADVLRAHRDGQPDDPCRLRADLPRPLGDVLLRALRRDREDRYQTARGLAADLRRAASAAPGRTIPLATADVAGPERTGTRFVGRRDAARRVAAAVDRASRGQGGVVLVEGRAGAGRSRFLHELAEPLRRRGALVLSARCAAFEQRLPLDPIVQALAHLRATLPTMADRTRTARMDSLRATTQGRAGGLVRLVPTLADVLPGAEPCEPRLGPLRDALLATALPEHPTVLIVDDAHRADPASQEVLAGLARGLAGAPFVLVLSTPTDDGEEEGDAGSSLDEPAQGFLLRVLHAGGRGVERVELAPFSLDEVESWLDGVLDGGERDLAEWLHAHSGGIPQLLGELVRDLRAAGALRPRASGWRWDAARAEELEVGQGAGARALKRLEAEPPRVKRVLAATARIAPEVAFDEVAAVLGPFGVSRGVVAAALARAEQEGVLDAVSGRLRFRHSSVRRALAAAWPTAAAEPLHRRAREVLAGDGRAEDLPDRLLFAVAHHALKDGSGVESVPLLAGASERARRRRDPTMAAEFARAAADRADCRQRAPVLLELAEAELSRGRLAAAQAVAKKARLAAAHPELSAKAWSVEAEAAELAGRLPAAERAARAGLLLEGCALGEGAMGRWWGAGRALLRWSWGRRARGSRGRLLRVATRLAAARGSVEAPALVVLSWIEARRAGARTDAAIAWGALTLGVAERTGALRLAERMLGSAPGVGGAWLRGCRGVLDLMAGRPEPAREALEAAVDGLRGAGLELEARQLLGVCALATRDGGDLAGLRRSLQGDSDRDPRLGAWSLVVSAWLAGIEGGERRAVELATAAVEAAERLQDGPLVGVALARRAKFRAGSDPAGAAQDARRALEAAGRRRGLLALEARVLAAAELTGLGQDGAAELPTGRELRGLRGVRWKAARVRAVQGGDTAQLRRLAKRAEADGRWWDAATVWLGPGLGQFEDAVAGLAALRRCSGTDRTTLARSVEGAERERRLDESTRRLVSRLKLRGTKATSRPGDDTVAWESGEEARTGRALRGIWDGGTAVVGG